MSTRGGLRVLSGQAGGAAFATVFCGRGSGVIGPRHRRTPCSVLLARSVPRSLDVGARHPVYGLSVYACAHRGESVRGGLGVLVLRVLVRLGAGVCLSVGFIVARIRPSVRQRALRWCQICAQWASWCIGLSWPSSAVRSVAFRAGAEVGARVGEFMRSSSFVLSWWRGALLGASWRPGAGCGGHARVGAAQ